MRQHGITVHLRSIQYAGRNIGSNTEFTISVNGTETKIGHDINQGTTRYFDLPVLIQTVDDSEVKVAISVDVREERELAPDRGSNTQEFVIRAHGRQPLPLTVPVAENLGLLGRSKALADFIFNFEADFFEFGQPGIRYVSATENGWLLVRGENGADDFSLPLQLKVEVTKIDEEREYFTVLEGPLRGQNGSARLRNGVSSLSPSPVRRDTAIELIYHDASNRLQVPELGLFVVAEPPVNPYPIGQVFRIEIPDFPHAGGRKYEKQATFATTWFRIDDPKVPDRYLHTGRASAGCSTVTERKRWDEIYLFLINRRIDDRFVATVRVADS